MWSQERKSNEAVRVATVKQGEQRLFVALSDATKVWDIQVHYVRDLKRSVPCIGEEDCPFHNSPLIRKSYAPGLMFSQTFSYGANFQEPLWCLQKQYKPKWLRRAIELTWGVCEIIQMLQPGTVFSLRRPATNSNAKVDFYVFNQVVSVDQNDEIDVRRVLERVWKLDGVLFSSKKSEKSEVQNGKQ